MANKFVVVIKEPCASILIDGVENASLEGISCLIFTQDGLKLYVPILASSSIAYIKELNPDELKRFNDFKLKTEGKIITPSNH